jgi:hypothetical protein
MKAKVLVLLALALAVVGVQRKKASADDLWRTATEGS